MKNLENFGVQELNQEEIKNSNGGFLLGPLTTIDLALTAMGIHDSIDHPDAFLDGFLN